MATKRTDSAPAAAELQQLSFWHTVACVLDCLLWILSRVLCCLCLACFVFSCTKRAVVLGRQSAMVARQPWLCCLAAVGSKVGQLMPTCSCRRAGKWASQACGECFEANWMQTIQQKASGKLGAFGGHLWEQQVLGT
jgi:hypothetical protein